MTEFEKLVLAKLDFLDTKIEDKFRETNTRLSKHMDDEEGKIDAMGEKFIHMQRSVDSFSTGVNALVTDIQTAFLPHPEDNARRDYAGHHADHSTRKRWYDRWAKWLEDAFGNLVKVAIASGAVWLVYEIWQHIIKGPQQ